MTEGADEGPGRRPPEPGVTPEEARRAPQGASAEEVERLVPRARVAKTHTNTDQTLIAVTGDRAKIVVTEAAAKLARRREWSGPLGLFVGLAMSLLTADFRETLGIQAATVEGVVVAATIAAGLWTAVTAVRALSTPSQARVVAETVDALKHQASA